MSAELTVSGLTLGFYGSPVLRGVDLVIGAGKLTGLIGPNGAGKSTLFNAISGLFRPDGGRVRMGKADTTALAPEKLVANGLVRSFQLARGFPKLSVFQHLMLYGRDQPGETLWQAIVGTRAAREREAALAERAWETAKFLRLAHMMRNPGAAFSGGPKEPLG